MGRRFIPLVRNFAGDKNILQNEKVDVNPLLYNDLPFNPPGAGGYNPQTFLLETRSPQL
jgi:hypothetical protein